MLLVAFSLRMCCSRAEVELEQVFESPKRKELTLESQPVRGLSGGIFTASNEASWHLPLQLVGASKEAGVGSAISKRNTKSSRVSDDDIGTPLAWWFEHSEGQEVRSADHKSPGRVNRFNHGGVIVYRSVDVWVLNEDPTNIFTSGFVGKVRQDVSDNQVDAESLGPRAEYRDRLWEDMFIDEKGSFLLVGTDECHDHSLSCTGSLIKERGV